MEITSVRKPLYSIDLNLLKNHLHKQQYPPFRVLCVNDRLSYINSGLLSTMKKFNYNIKMLPLGNYSNEKQKILLNNVLKDFKPHFVFTPGWSIGIFDTDQFLQIIKEHNIPHVYWSKKTLSSLTLSLQFLLHTAIMFLLRQKNVIKNINS